MAISAYQRQEHLAQSLNTLILRDALSALSLYSSKLRALDLGPAHPETVSFFNQYNCKLYIMDATQLIVGQEKYNFKESKQELNTATDENVTTRLENLFTKFIPANQEFDLILSWDILNYIDNTLRKFLVNYLSQHTHSHSLLHTFIATSQYINEAPGNFYIQSGDSVFFEPRGSQVEHIPFTRYEIQKHMPNMQVTKAILMRNGLQEMALRFGTNRSVL